MTVGHRREIIEFIDDLEMCWHPDRLFFSEDEECPLLSLNGARWPEPFRLDDLEVDLEAEVILPGRDEDC